MTGRRRKVVSVAAASVVFYVVVATTVMRFRYPSMTETELFLNIPRALVFGEPNLSR